MLRKYEENSVNVYRIYVYIKIYVRYKEIAKKYK